MKRYCVVYQTTTSTDASIEAKNKAEAERKLKEVIPDARVEGIWELKESEDIGLQS